VSLKRSGGYARHPSALGLAPPARVGTEAAVIVVSGMPLALLSTRRARLGTHATYLLRERPAPCHYTDRRRTGVCAIVVELDASGEPLHIIFMETCIAAHLARNEALHAGGDARVILAVVVRQVSFDRESSHWESPW
jgi:hypothetical protein